MMTANSSRQYWILTLSAAAVLAVTMGSRQSMGLFVSPLNTATGLGIASVSFALAIGQFVWGAVQPLSGAMATRFGYVPVLAVGVIASAIGTVLATTAETTLGLVLSLGLLAAGGAGAASFSVLMGCIAQRLPESRRAFASGFINAGGSFGQFVFAPLVSALILGLGWMNSLWVLGAIILLALPLMLPFRAGAATAVSAAAQSAAQAAGPGLREQIGIAFRDRSYWCLHLGFFTCGFHIAFLITHLPGEVALCGLSASVSATALALIGAFNIAGSLGVGWLSQRYRMKGLLSLMYASRAVAVGVYLVAPKDALTLYVFAAVLGITWLATVPPTAGLVGKLFGVRHLSTLFGLTLLSHQIGGFLGAWLGGVAMAGQGNYQWVWYADMVLALGAALVTLPVREAPVQRAALATR